MGQVLRTDCAKLSFVFCFILSCQLLAIQALIIDSDLESSFRSHGKSVPCGPAQSRRQTLALAEACTLLASAMALSRKSQAPCSAFDRERLRRDQQPHPHWVKITKRRLAFPPSPPWAQRDIVGLGGAPFQSDCSSVPACPCRRQRYYTHVNYSQQLEKKRATFGSCHHMQEKILICCTLKRLQIRQS